MDNDNICQYYKKGKTKEDLFLGNKVLFCKYAAKKGCPYKNSADISLSGESAGTICQSEGLIKKLQETNSE
jgi:hypothetical protein